VARGRVDDLHSLTEFLRGRLATAGLVDAALAAATCERACALVLAVEPWRSSQRFHCQKGEAEDKAPWGQLVAEAEARQPSAALRAAWRVQGRALLRVAQGAWPGPILDGLALAVPEGAPHPVVLGACAAAAGLGSADAAAIAAHHAVMGPASAAVRLLGLDPLAVAGILAGLEAGIDRVATEASALAGGPLSELACLSSPLLEVGAEDHAAWEVRLFAS
jgi:urease accessory protein